MMIKETRAIKTTTVCVIALCLLSGFMFGIDAAGDETLPAPNMPANWKIVSDFQAPRNQVEAISAKLNANLNSVRNIIYDVDGKRVQLNVITASDPENAEKLMATLGSMKAEEALLRKNLTIYEFVGQNDVFPLIMEGRKHLDSNI